MANLDERYVEEWLMATIAAQLAKRRHDPGGGPKETSRSANKRASEPTKEENELRRITHEYFGVEPNK